MNSRWRSDLPLSPRGTARQRLAPAPAYPPELLAELGDSEVGVAALTLGAEVAGWAPELSPADRTALLGLVARSLVAVGEGSTRFGLDGPARALLAKVPALAGGPGDRTPLIVEGG